MKLELGEKEVGTIIEILKFSLDSCPVESIGAREDITSDEVEGLIAKLEGARSDAGERRGP